MQVDVACIKFKEVSINRMMWVVIYPTEHPATNKWNKEDLHQKTKYIKLHYKPPCFMQPLVH